MIIEENMYKLVRMVNEVIMSLCVVIYLIPLGAYHVWSSSEDPTFDEQKAAAAAIIGIIFCLSMLVQCLLRCKNKMIASIAAIVSGCIQLLFIGTEATIQDYIIRMGEGDVKFFYIGGKCCLLRMKSEVDDLRDWLPLHRVEMGIKVLDIMDILIKIFIVLAICLLVIYVVNYIVRKILKREFLEIERVKITEEKFYKNKIRLLMRIVNIVVAIVIFRFIYEYSFETYSTGNLLEILSQKQNLIFGYAIPILVFLLVFVDRWIVKGKWYYVIISYTVLLYILYILECFHTDMFFDPEQSWFQRIEIIKEFNGKFAGVIGVMFAAWGIEHIINEIKMYMNKREQNVI